MKKRLSKEDPIHAAIYAFLCATLPADALIWHTPNEGKRSPMERGRQKRMGLRAGVPDLLVLYGGKLVGLEVKAPGGRLTEGQADFAAAMHRNGGHWSVVRSIEDAETAMAAAGVPLKGRTRADLAALDTGEAAA